MVPKQQSGGLSSFDPLCQSQTDTPATPAADNSQPQLTLPDVVAIAFASPQGPVLSPEKRPANDESSSQGLSAEAQRALMLKIQEDAARMRGNDESIDSDPFKSVES